MSEPNELKSTVLHLRLPNELHKVVQQLGIVTGVPTATQARLLIREALKMRKLIK